MIVNMTRFKSVFCLIYPCLISWVHSLHFLSHAFFGIKQIFKDLFCLLCLLMGCNFYYFVLTCAVRVFSMQFTISTWTAFKFYYTTQCLRALRQNPLISRLPNFVLLFSYILLIYSVNPHVFPLFWFKEPIIIQGV